MLNKLKKLLSRVLCRIGIHDWRNGPGENCVECGHPDDFWR